MRQCEPIDAVRRHDVRVIMALAVVAVLVMLAVTATDAGSFVGFDTHTYDAARRRWQRGVMDWFRTPVYPLFSRVMEVLSHRWHGSLWMALVQNALFLWSIPYFYRLAWRVAAGRRVAFVTTLFYAVFPGMIYWNNYVMTESMSLVGMVLWLYATVRFVDTARLRYAVGVTGLLFGLIMLRPAFLVLLPLTVVILAVMWWRGAVAHRRRVVQAMGGTLVVAMMVGGYACYYHHLYGIYGLTTVGEINTYDILHRAHLLYTPVIDDPEMRAQVEAGIDVSDPDSVYRTIASIALNYGPVPLQRLNRASIARQPWPYVRELAGHVPQAARQPLFVFYNFHRDGWLWVQDHLIPPMWWLYVLLVAHVGVMAVRWRRHGADCIGMMLSLIGLAALASVLIFAQDDWSRLVFPFMAVYLLIPANILARRSRDDSIAAE